MKKSLFLSVVLGFALAGGAAEISSVAVRQLKPLSTDVRVTFVVSGAENLVDVSVLQAWDGTHELDVAALSETIRGERFGLTDGEHAFTFDPIAAFGGGSRDELADFRIRLGLAEATEDRSEVLYKIIDLTTFAETDVTRLDLLNDKYGTYETDFSKLDAEDGKYWTALENVLIWTGVTNNPAYKTTKLVMRKIPAKDKTFSAGDIPGTYKLWANSDGNPTVTLREDFWIGVFEMTEKQYQLLASVNGKPASIKAPKGDAYPVSDVSYSTLRGKPTNWGDGFPADPHTVTSGSAIQAMRNNLKGKIVDLPEEYEWEYAARAGTTNDLHIGYRIAAETPFKSALAKIGWYDYNSGAAKHPVGELRPNAFGLYDVLGNVREGCRDLTDGGDNPSPPAATLDAPQGMTDTSLVYNISRGGTYARGYAYVTIQCRRLSEKLTNETAYMGFRLWMKADD